MVQAITSEKMTALTGLVFDVEGLRESFRGQDGKKAPGVDGMKKANFVFPPAVWLTRTGSGMVQLTMSDSARGRFPYPCMAEILWRRRETRWLTEKTKFSL